MKCRCVASRQEWKFCGLARQPPRTKIHTPKAPVAPNVFPRWSPVPMRNYSSPQIIQLSILAAGGTALPAAAGHCWLWVRNSTRATRRRHPKGGAPGDFSANSALRPLRPRRSFFRLPPTNAPRLLFRRHVAQIRTKLDDLVIGTLHRAINPLDHRHRFLLAKRRPQILA